MKNLEDTTKLGGLNQRLPIQQCNKILKYSGTHQQKDDTMDNFFSSVPARYGTTDVELTIGIKTLLTDVYAIGSKSGIKSSEVFQDRFCECGIPINIWSDNAQEEFMGSVRKLLRTHGEGSKQFESHKHNQKPAKRRIQEIKGTTWTVLDHSGAPNGPESSTWHMSLRLSTEWCTTHCIGVIHTRLIMFLHLMLHT